MHRSLEAGAAAEATVESLGPAALPARPPLAPGGKLSPGPGKVDAEVAAHQRARIYDAMIQIVAERGYEAVKVRELVLRAGVSSRAFYEQFKSKEDCFLRTYELVTRRASRRIILSQAGERDWRIRPRHIFAALAAELESEPETARFALIEAHAATPAALALAQQAESTFAAVLGESFARDPNGVAVPPLVVEGIVGGIGYVVRSRLLAKREGELAGLGASLTNWALCYPGKPARVLPELDLQSVWRDTMLEPLPGGASSSGGESGDRELLLSSVAELASNHGYDSLTVTRIRTNVKVNRKTFDTYFTGVEDCFVLALEQKVSEVLTQAARAQAAGRTWPGGVYRAMAALCDQTAEDPLLARLCLVDHYEAGSNGARCRQRLVDGVSEQFGESTPFKLRPSPLVTEASQGAIWSLFHHHVIRDRSLRRRVAATLSFMALAPAVGADAAVAAIRNEQKA
jgi:AcrR family transcriptional regulator